MDTILMGLLITPPILYFYLVLDQLLDWTIYKYVTQHWSHICCALVLLGVLLRYPFIFEKIILTPNGYRNISKFPHLPLVYHYMLIQRLHEPEHGLWA